MAEASASMDYEHAAELRDQIVAIRSQLRHHTQMMLSRGLKLVLERRARAAL